MENLSLSDAPPPAPGPGGGPQPPATPQLPPQMFTTAAQLLDLTDKKLVVVLRDGRKLIGVLRSWDQFANLVLQSTIERIFVPADPTTLDAAANDAAEQPAAPSSPRPRGLYADILHGVFLVRGENVMLLGEIDLDRDDDPPPGYEAADLEMVKRLAAEQKAKEKEANKGRVRKLATLGFEGENMGEIIL